MVRTVTDYRTVGPDTTVGMLDSDVPAGINFAKVLPFSVYNLRKKLYAPGTLTSRCNTGGRFRS